MTAGHIIEEHKTKAHRNGGVYKKKNKGKLAKQNQNPNKDKIKI